MTVKTPVDMTCETPFARRRFVTGFGAAVLGLALPVVAGPMAARGQVGGVMLNDPFGMFRVAFPDNPQQVEIPLGSDSWQWFQRSDFYVANGSVVTAQISRMLWTPRFRIAMQTARTDPAGVLLDQDFFSSTN